MNELQMALLAAGGAAVALVWGYNKWQERKHRQLAEKVFRGAQADVLLPDDPPPSEQPAFAERREPVIEPVAEPVADARVETGAVVEVETTIEAIGSPAPQPVAASAEVEAIDEIADEAPRGLPPLPAEWADEIADCAVRIDFAEAVPAPALWAAQAPWAARVAKRLSWLGYDERGEIWKLLSAHDTGRYAAVCASLQLADRRGAVSDGELAAFLDGIRELARQFGGEADVPARDRVLTHAQALDEFCAGVDVQLGVNVVDAGGGVFAGTKLRGLAEAMGLTLRDDGMFHALDDAGQTLFTLGNGGTEHFEADAMKSLATHGVTLMLDVPRVAGGTAVFGRMLGVARQLTQGLGGVLVDAQRQSLSPEMIGGIDAKIDEVQRKMAAHQIPAGSVRALRLFS